MNILFIAAARSALTAPMGDLSIDQAVEKMSHLEDKIGHLKDDDIHNSASAYDPTAPAKNRNTDGIPSKTEKLVKKFTAQIQKMP